MTLYPKWIKVNYSVSFDTDVGLGPPVDDTTLRIGEGYTIPCVPYSVSWHNSKWNTSENGAGIDILPGDYTLNDSIIQSLFDAGTSITLHPKFIKNEYGITFNANSGAGSVPSAIGGKVLDSELTIPAVGLTRIGYDVSVWNSEASGTGVDVIPGDGTLSDSLLSSLFGDELDVILYPKWIKRTYSISFDGDHGIGSAASITGITIDTDITLPEIDFIRIGYSAAVWNTRAGGAGLDMDIDVHAVDESFITTYLSESNQIVLYPKWIKNEYEILFGANSGTGTVPSPIGDRVLEFGIKIPAIGLTRIGYHAAVWNSSTDGKGTDVAPGDRILDGELITSLFGDSLTVTLYPKWIKNEYSIIFDRNQGIGSVASIGNTVIDRSILLPEIDFIRIGYHADVWNTESDGTGIDLTVGEYDLDEDFIIDHFKEGLSLTLYPKWIRNEYTISFDSKADPSITIDALTVATGDAYIIEDVPYSKAWHTSVRWNTSENGTGIDIIPGDHVLDEEEIVSLFNAGSCAVLYPKWIKNEYAVTFHANFGTGIVPASINGKVLDSEFRIPAVGLVRIGYHVSVWNTVPNGTGIDVDPGDKELDDALLTLLFGDDRIITLYPKWIENDYSVTFDNNHGSGSVSPIGTMNIGDELILPDVGYTRIGYHVSVWNTRADGNGSDLSPGSHDFNEDFIKSHIGNDLALTLYPKWVMTVYTISFSSYADVSKTPGDTLAAIGLEYTLPDVPYTRPWHHSDLWNTSSDGTGTDLTPGKYTLDGATIQSLFGTGPCVTLHPKWIMNEYSISFDRNSGIGDVPASIAGKVLDSDISISSVGLTRTGYHAIVWNSASDGKGVDVAPGDKGLDDGLLSSLFGDSLAVTLYPKWVKNVYSISFERNSGIGDIPDTLGGKVIDSKFNIQNIGLTRVGYHASVWNTSSDGMGYDVIPGDKVLDDDLLISLFGSGLSVILYPKWIKDEFNILFDGNLGTGDVSPISGITIDGRMSIPDIGFLRVGYKADVWNTKYDGSGIDITPGEYGIDSGLITSYFGTAYVAILYPKWIKVGYSINFQCDDQETVIDAIRVRIDEGYDIPKITYSKAWHSFVNWNTSEDGTGMDIPSGGYTLGEGAIELLFPAGTVLDLYPKWVKNQYSITFSRNSGTGDLPASIIGRTLGSDIAVPVIGLTRTGYDAAVWNSEPDGTGVDVPSGDTEMDDGFLSALFDDVSTRILYPKWEKVGYSILFRSDEGTDIDLDGPAVSIDDVYDIPDVPLTKAWHSCTCWNTSNDGSGIDISPGRYTLNETSIVLLFGSGTDLVLYPRWVKIQYGFVFDPNSGTGKAPASVAGKVLDSEFTIPAVDLIRVGYDTVIWNTEHDGTGTDMVPGDHTLDDAMLSAFFCDGTAVILYPKWEAKVYSVSFDGNRGKGEIPKTMSGFTIGDTLSVPSAELSRVGYAQGQWDTLPDGNGLHVSPGRFELSEASILMYFGNSTDLTLYAVWTEIGYDILFNLNSGSGERIGPIDVIIGERVTIPGVSYSRIGYHAEKWNTSDTGGGTPFEKGEIVWDEGLITSGLLSGTSLILYPDWVKTVYTLRFDANGGSGGAYDDIPVSVGDTVSFPESTSKMTGYTAERWNTAADGTGLYHGTQPLTMNEQAIGLLFPSGTECTFYIEWVPVDYTVILHDGTVRTIGNGLNIGDVLTVPSAEAYSRGYHCDLWNTSPEGNGLLIAFGDLRLTAPFIEEYLSSGTELHLYPVWSPNEYVVLYDTDGGSVFEAMTEGANLRTPVTIPSEVPTLDGHSFRGWCIGDTVLMPGCGYTMDISHVPDVGYIILRAEWGIDITFTGGLHPGDVSMPSDIMMKGKSCKVSLTSPVSGDTDWRFVGYSTDHSADVRYPVESMSDLTFDRNTELSAVWSVPITGSSSGCTVSSAERTVAGRPWSMGIDIPRGYAVDGCSVMMGDTEISYGDGRCSAEKVLGPISYDIKAVPMKYILALSTGSGTVTDEGWELSILEGRNYYTKEYTVESDDILLPNVVPGDRYTLFGGWADDAKVLGKGSIGDRIIDVVWTFREFSFETLVDGRSTAMTMTVEGDIPEPAAPDGYRFSGWEYLTDSGEMQSLSSMTDIDDGMQLYATFEPIPDELYELIAYPLIVILVCLISGYVIYCRS